MAVAIDENSTLSVIAARGPLRIELALAQLVSGSVIATSYFYGRLK